MNTDQLIEREGSQQIDTQTNKNNQDNNDGSFIAALMSQFEYRYPHKAGSAYMLAFVVYAGSMIVVCNDYIVKETPFFQQMFLSLVTSLILNFNIARKRQVELSLQNVQESQTLTIIAFSYTVGFTCTTSIKQLSVLCVAFSITNYQSCLFIFFSSWIISIMVEINIFGERYIDREIMSFFGLTVGYFLCSQPNLLGYGLKDNQFKMHLLGIILSLQSSFLLYFGSSNLRTLCSTKCVTVYHNIFFCLVLVLSITFPIHKFQSFSIEILIFSIINGICLQIFGQLAIRSIQIDQTAKVLALLYFLGPFITIQSLITDGFSFAKFGGLIFCVVSCFYMVMDQKAVIKVGNFSVDLEDNYKYQEMNEVK